MFLQTAAPAASRRPNRPSLATAGVLSPVRLLMVLLCLAAASGRAAMGPIPLASLVAGAELIVMGHVDSVGVSPVVSSTCAPARRACEDKPLAEAKQPSAAVADLRVSAVLKGPSALRRIQIAFSFQEDSPRYQPGETVIVFVSRAAPNAAYTTLGMLQGRFVIIQDTVVREQMPVSAFMARISDAVQALGGPSVSSLGGSGGR